MNHSANFSFSADSSYLIACEDVKKSLRLFSEVRLRRVKWSLSGFVDHFLPCDQGKKMVGVAGVDAEGEPVAGSARPGNHLKNHATMEHGGTQEQ